MGFFLIKRVNFSTRSHLYRATIQKKLAKSLWCIKLGNRVDGKGTPRNWIIIKDSGFNQIGQRHIKLILNSLKSRLVIIIIFNIINPFEFTSPIFGTEIYFTTHCKPNFGGSRRPNNKRLNISIIHNYFLMEK